MKVAIIGFGNIGKEYLKIINKINKITTIYIVDVKSLKQVKNKKIKYLSISNFKKALPEISHAFICTPSYLHYKSASFLLKNKINVLIEKPFVLKTTHSKKLIELTNLYKTKCWVMFQNRANSSIKKLSKILLTKSLGKVETVIAKLIWKRDAKYYLDEWHGKYQYDGGVLVNQAIHLIDVIVYLFGKIDKFTGFLSYNKKKLDAEDLVNLVFKTNKNIPVSFIATTRASRDFEMSIDIIASKKRIKVEGLALNKIYVEDENKKKFAKDSFNTNVGHGINHKLIVKEFLKKGTIDKFNLEISKNTHLIRLLNSVYNKLLVYNGFKISNENSILGKNE